MSSSCPRVSPAFLIRRFGLLVAATLSLAGLAGCGSGDDDGGDDAIVTERHSAVNQPIPRPEPPTGEGRGGVRLTEIGSFTEPVHVTQPSSGGDELYVVEKGGTVRIVSGGEILPEPFLDISSQVSGASEQGLLSIAFSPDYEQDGLVYADYTDLEGDTRIVEYRRSADGPLRADPASARELLFVDQPAENHNGGLVVFGPGGLLYIGLGDGGGADDEFGNGQNPDTLLAKILRIDPGEPGAKPEVYATGLRNPWRFSFDRQSGLLLIGDVGQNEFEEIDVVATDRAAGANFGWSAFEGKVPFNEDVEAEDPVPPALVLSHSDGNCSVTGGLVVRDRRLRSLYGRYLYADFCAGELRSFVPAPGRAIGDRALGPVVPAVSSFGEDRIGRVYVVSLEGTVFRLDPR